MPAGGTGRTNTSQGMPVMREVARTGPLSGTLVIDLTRVLAGPYCTMLLSDLGARVIKIEKPGTGDDARRIGPFVAGRSAYFLSLNRGKESVALDLQDSGDRTFFERLLARADVLVENFRPGVMARLGYGWDDLHVRFPRLVYAAISGFGQTGPDAEKPAYDQIIQGLSGVMDINGDDRLHPLRAGFPVCDTVGGLNAAFAIMGALYHRQRTGEAQFIDIAMLDSIMPLMGWVAANLLIGGQHPVPIGNDNFTAAPSGMFVTRDGYINIAANQQQQWEDLCDVLGVAELKADPRFQERDTRKKNRHALTPILEEKLKTASTTHWVDALNAKGIPSGDILTLEQALTQPQIAHRQSIQAVKEEKIGEIRIFSLTAKFEKTPGGIETPPPRLSAHTNDILKGLGYSDADIAAMKESGAI